MMTGLELTGWQTSLVVAEASRWESMGGGVRAKETEISSVEIMVAVGVGLLILAVLGYLFHRYGDARRTRTNSPRKLFKELCAAHQLDSASRRLLASVAKWQRLKNPARLFVEPERFAAVNLSAKLRNEQPRLESLQQRLFEVPAELAVEEAPAVAD